MENTNHSENHTIKQKIKTLQQETCGACQKACSSKFRIKKVQMHQLASFSKSFTKKDIKQGTTKIFIPGCSLAGYNKSVVTNLYQYLKAHIEDMDIIIQCCGQPSLDIGDNKKFETSLSKFQEVLDRNGIQQVIVSCPNCYDIYKKHLKSVEIITVWEILNEIGIPKHLKQHYNSDTKYALHDPCRIRKEKQIHDSIRNILTELGISVVEFDKNRDKTICCGAKNMNHTLNPKLYEFIATKRADSTKANNIISYCQTCVDSLSITGKNTLHIAELLFNDDVMKGKAVKQTRNSFYTAWKNRWDIVH